MGKSNYNDRRERDEDEDEEEEEALSLCDLPMKFLSKDDKFAAEAEERKSVPELGEDFNFVRPSSFEMEMCVADELFFQGQILPLRRLSSDNALTGLQRQQHGRDEQSGWCYSSTSGEYYYSTSRSTSSSSSRSNISSRSNSINSTSNTITTNYDISKAKSKVINQFHTHPSPKPQIKLSNLRPATASSSSTCRRQNSSLWEFFRVGLVRTPEIELKNLKLRTNRKNTTANPGNSRNSSSNSNNNSSSSSAKIIDSKSTKYKKIEGSSSILSGCNCKCSIDVVENTVTSKSRRIVLLKSKSNGNKIEQEDMKEKLLQHNSNNRTFEWLKQLSIENSDDCL